MIKKLFIVGAIGFAAIALVGTTKIGSHVCTWSDRFNKKIEESVDPETELNRIRHEVSKLDTDMDKVKGDLAEVRSSARVLQADVEKLQGDITQLDKAIAAHGTVLKKASKTDTIEWGNRLVSYTQAKDLLEREVQRYRRLKEDLAKKSTDLENTEKARDQIQEELEAMKASRDDLNRQVADMDYLIKQAKVDQVRSKYQNDGSRMADIKKSLQDLHTRVMVQREKLNVDADFGREAPKRDRSIDEILADKDAAKPAPNKPADVKIATKVETKE